MKNKFWLIVLSVLMLGIIAGCAPGKGTQINVPAVTVPAVNVPAVSFSINQPGLNSLANTADANGNVAGVFMGLWHGVISPATLVISFVNPDVQMYEVHNNNSPYNLGFLLGVAIIFSLLGLLIGSRRR